MIQSSAALPSLLQAHVRHTGAQILSGVLTFVGGVLTIALLAQIAIPLSFTPVPITGQTLGVALIALLFGRFRAVTAVAGYLGLGALGLPFFAETAMGAGFGPTAGYLVGMLAASFMMGHMADAGFAKTFRGSLFTALIGSVTIFAFGLAALSFYVPNSALFAWGLYPFIPGDIVKILIAAVIASSVAKSQTTKSGVV